MQSKNYKPHPSLPAFENAVNKGDLENALEIAAKNEGLV